MMPFASSTRVRVPGAQDQRRATRSHASTPPIVLVHGLWLTPRSWEGWKARFERRSGHLQQFGDAALCDAGSRSGRGSIARTEARQTPLHHGEASVARS